MTIVYGLKTCDTCRKALQTLESAKVEHRFHDLRADGLDPATLDRWIGAVGWEKLLNRKSTTWRGLDDSDRDGLDTASAAALMRAHPTLVKRPVIEAGDEVFVGWSDAVRKALGAD